MDLIIMGITLIAFHYWGISSLEHDNGKFGITEGKNLGFMEAVSNFLSKLLNTIIVISPKIGLVLIIMGVLILLVGS